jgi:cobalt transporter subunit CbtB
MAQQMNNPQNASITIPVSGSISLPIARRMPAMAVLMFGLVTLYFVGFSTASVAHNATHDTRHASGFPCH